MLDNTLAAGLQKPKLGPMTALTNLHALTNSGCDAKANNPNAIG